MAKNKNALVRYRALDKCFSSKIKRYYMTDLIEACRNALEQVNGNEGPKGAEGVQRRQIYKDIADMEMMYGVIIESHRDGHRVYFRYAGSKTMADSGPSQEEIDLLMNAVAVVQRFDGIPHCDWLDDLNKKFYTTSRLGNDIQKVVSFQHNPYLAGMDKWYRPIFEAIMSQKVIEITYHPFGKEARTVVVNPYYLKQYNNRWFLIARQKGYDRLSNYAIDRIQGMQETGRTYEALPEGFDFNEWFSDVVGVSVSKDKPVEDVVIHANDRSWHYIATKPIHESQYILEDRQTDGRWEIHLKVQDNYELRSVLRSYGNEIEVMAPESLRREMKEEAEEILKMYNDEI